MLEDLRKYFADCGYYLFQDKDTDKFIECAMDAYRNYPLMNYFYNSDEKKSRRTWIGNIAALKDCTAIFADSDEVNGFSIVAPEFFQGESTMKFLAAGGWRVGIPTLVRMAKYEQKVKRLRTKFTGLNCIYYYNLSIRSTAQGKGIGSRMMNDILRYTDKTGIPCFFETHTGRNVSLYERLGCRLLAEEPLAKGTSITHRSMIYTNMEQ